MQTRVIVTLTLLIPALAIAQSRGDWNAVRQIDRGTLITIQAQDKIRCEFVDATNDKLFCDQERPFRSTDRRTIDRNDIREVRLELTEQNNAFVNGCIGGAAGLLAGALTQSRERPGAVDPILVVAGATVGGVGFHRVHLLHGRVVYRR